MLPSITSCSRSAPSISISKCSQVHQSIPKYYKVHQSILVKYSKVLWSIPKCYEVFQSIATGRYGWYGPSISRAPKYNASWCQLCQLCQLCCIFILAKQNWEGSTWIWKWIGSPWNLMCPFNARVPRFVPQKLSKAINRSWYKNAGNILVEARRLHISKVVNYKQSMCDMSFWMAVPRYSMLTILPRSLGWCWYVVGGVSFTGWGGTPILLYGGRCPRL